MGPRLRGDDVDGFVMKPPASALSDLQGTIVLAGAGKMGGAMLSGWLARGLDANRVAVIEPYPSDEIKALAAKGVRLNPAPQGHRQRRGLGRRGKTADVSRGRPGAAAVRGVVTLVVSIMAGITIAAINEVCGGSVVRAMPNTPAAIGRGITVAVAARQCQRRAARGRRCAAARHRRGGMDRATRR